MKILIDENLPKKLKKSLQELSVYTIQEKQWLGLKNGDLIQKMLGDGFDTLITLDQNLKYQQNLSKYPIAVLLINLENNQYSTILPYLEKIKSILSGNIQPGIHTLIPPKESN
ncbi:hypothetical protein P3G55_06825 [Leptospira sp. 96542]|nr:hypothetical protein [Leptospira sp. 96542]